MIKVHESYDTLKTTTTTRLSITKATSKNKGDIVIFCVTNTMIYFFFLHHRRRRHCRHRSRILAQKTCYLIQQGMRTGGIKYKIQKFIHPIFIVVHTYTRTHIDGVYIHEHTRS